MAIGGEAGSGAFRASKGVDDASLRAYLAAVKFHQIEKAAPQASKESEVRRTECRRRRSREVMMVAAIGRQTSRQIFAGHRWFGQAKVATISERSPVADGKPVGADLAADLGLPRAGTLGVIDEEVFESIYNPGKLLLLVSWKDAASAARWQPKAAASGTLRHRQVRIIRDYGMTDRREAPQYYRPV